MAIAKKTHDHEFIRYWAEDRGGVPAVVRTPEDYSGTILRIDFGDLTEDVDEITWDQFFDIFESDALDFVYQEEEEDEEDSLVFKFVNREYY